MKSNEINAIPLLLERLQLTGALVIIDAMGTQTKIAAAILARGADYLLALKDNQRRLAGEVALFFDRPEAQALPVFETTDADHGRLETRRHRVSHDVAWLNGTSVVPWPSPVSRQSGSDRRRLASTSCSQPRSVIFETAIFAAATASPLSSSRAMFSGRWAPALSTMVWVSVSYVMAGSSIVRSWQGKRRCAT